MKYVILVDYCFDSMDSVDDVVEVYHFPGRTLKVKLSGGSNVNTESNLGQLCGLALVSGFDWVYHESSSYIRISVIPDGEHFIPYSNIIMRKNFN